MERKRTTARGLYDTMKAYIDSNEHSRDVAERWLCSVLEPKLVVIAGIMNNHPRIQDQPAIETFRGAEIEKEIASKRKEIERLEREYQDAKKRSLVA